MNYGGFRNVHNTQLLARVETHVQFWFSFTYRGSHVADSLLPPPRQIKVIFSDLGIALVTSFFSNQFTALGKMAQRRKSKTLGASGLQQMMQATQGPMTRLKKKRTRILRLPDPDENPFCADRQIEDIFTAMIAKPKMVQDLDSKPPPQDPQKILPTSVFAPERQVLERRWAGQKISDVPDSLSHVIGSALSYGAPKENDDGTGAWTLPGQSEEEREEYKPPEVEEQVVRKVPKVDARHMSFGHRPSSASRHFDPLTMTSGPYQYKKKGKRMPRVGLLSSNDLYAMLGQAAADYRFQKTLNSTHSSVVDNMIDNTMMTRENTMDDSEIESRSQITSRAKTVNFPAKSSSRGALQSSSQQMSLATGMPTPGGFSEYNSVSSTTKLGGSASTPMLVNASSTMNSVINPNVFEPVKAPAWLGGVYAVGGGRSLFDGVKEDRKKTSISKGLPTGTKGATWSQLEKPNFDNKIFYPPPQRAFKSALLADDVASTSSKDRIRRYTKLSAGAIITPVCEERQYSDMLEARDIETRIFKSAGTEQKIRVYQRNTGIHSLTPRKTFSHDMNEIRNVIRREDMRIAEEKAWNEENEGEEGNEGEEDEEEEGSDALFQNIINQSMEAVEKESEEFLYRTNECTQDTKEEVTSQEEPEIKTNDSPAMESVQTGRVDLVENGGVDLVEKGRVGQLDSITSEFDSHGIKEGSNDMNNSE